MASNVANLGFILRNGDKVSNGEVARIPVLVGQVAKGVETMAKSNNELGRALQTGLDFCDDAAKSDKALKGLGKVIGFARNNINPLIVGSSLFKVAMAKEGEKEKTFITESGTLGGMFLAEGWMKKNLTGLIAKLPIAKKWLPIIEGLVFIAGSIGASTLGNVVGKKTAELVEIPLGKEEREAWKLKKEQEKQLAELKKAQANNVYTPMDFKA